MLTRFTPLLLVFAAPVSAHNWYVSPAGNDANDGATLARSFRTVEKAASVVAPGDTVLLADGRYESADPKDPVLKTRISGRADAWISWKALPGQMPEIVARGWAGIDIRTSYQILEGIKVTGANDAIVLEEALEDGKKPTASAYFNTNGIIVDGRQNAPDAKPHHIVIRDCDVGKMPGGGIVALEADYVTIENNRVHENAWFMRYGGSGITLLNDWAHDQAPGYHVIIRGNLVWNNKTFVPWEQIGKLSDGNGILLDVTDADEAGATNPNADITLASQVASKPKSLRPVWTGRALIANNVSAFNGGSGIHTFRTAHVDIVNNTTYWNGTNVGYAELFANRSRDIVIVNNIMVPRPGGSVTSNNRNMDVRWDYNMYPAAQDVLKGPHDLVADPMFVKPNVDLNVANFRLLPQSKGVGSASRERPQPSSDGNVTALSVRNRGAFEF